MDYANIKVNVDNLLNDRKLTKDCKDQAVRLLLYHTYVAIDIYRYMTEADKETAGYWYRVNKNSFSLRGFLKERIRRRDKGKSPLYPSNRKESGVKEQVESIYLSKGGSVDDVVKEKQNKFWATLLPFKEKYGISMLERFHAYWAAPMKGTATLIWETMKSWSVSYRPKSWSKNPIELQAQTAELRLERAKGKGSSAASSPQNTAQQQAIAQQRAEENARREAELDKAKAEHVSYAEFKRLQRAYRKPQ